MLIAPNEEGFRGRHLRLHISASSDSMESNTMKNRSKEWAQDIQQAGCGGAGGPLGPCGGSPESLAGLAPDAPLLTTYPHATVLRLRVIQVVCGISAMVMGTVGFIEERGRLNLGLGIPAGAATVLAAAVSIHLSRSFSGPAGHGDECCPGWGPGWCPGWCGAAADGGVLWRLRRLGPLAGCWAVACLLHTALIAAATTAFVTQCRSSAAERNRDIVIVSVVQLSLSLGTLAAEAALVAVECRRWPLKAD